jgi:hypothetical protein
VRFTSAGRFVVAILSPAKTVVPVGATLLPTVTVPAVTIVPTGNATIVSAMEKGAVIVRVMKERTVARNFVAADLLVMVAPFA